MESIQFLPEEKAVQLLGKIELEHVYKRDGLLQGWADVPLAIHSDNGSVSLNLYNKQSQGESKLTVGRSGVTIRGVGGLRVRSRSGKPVFSSEQSEMRLSAPAKTLAAQLISTKRIASPTDEPLSVRSDSTIHLRGAEGTHLESKELLWSADQDIYLKSVNGSIVLSAKEGVFVDVKNIPIAIPNSAKAEKDGQFKVCVCMPQGKLFRIAVQPGQKTSCSHVDTTPSNNPCL